MVKRKILYGRIYELVVSCKGKKITKFSCLLLCAFMLTNCVRGGHITDSQIPVDSMAIYDVRCGVNSDTNPVQILYCERLLNRCIVDGMLDKRGVAVYHAISQSPSVSRYMELIEECEHEEGFCDVTAESNEWCNYYDYVLSVRENYCVE